MVGRAHIEVNVIAGPSCAVDCLIDTDGIFSDIVVKGATDLIEAKLLGLARFKIKSQDARHPDALWPNDRSLRY